MESWTLVRTKKTRFRAEAEIMAQQRKKGGPSLWRAAAVRRNAELAVGESVPKSDEGRSLGADRTRRAGTKLKRSRRFRMRGSASYSYPTHSKQMNHVPKWPTEFRRHVVSAHANQRVHDTHVHAATRTSSSRRAGPGRAGPCGAKSTGCTLYRRILRARNDGDWLQLQSLIGSVNPSAEETRFFFLRIWNNFQTWKHNARDNSESRLFRADFNHSENF